MRLTLTMIRLPSPKQRYSCAPLLKRFPLTVAAAKLDRVDEGLGNAVVHIFIAKEPRGPSQSFHIVGFGHSAGFPLVSQLVVPPLSGVAKLCVAELGSRRESPRGS